MKAPRIEPMPPIDDDHEGQDQNVVAHAGFDRDDRRDHDAGEAGQHRAEAEHDHEQPLDIDAERRDHPRIGGAGPHQHADPGVGHQHVKAGGDGKAGRR